MNNNKLIAAITGIVFLLMIVIGVSYAYFTANMQGGEETTTITVTGGTMGIVYHGGATINLENIIPNNNIVATKTFTVTGNNTTDIEMKYVISLVVESNSFSENALKYKLVSTNLDNNGTIVPSIAELTNIGAGSKTIQLGTGIFDSPTDGDKVHSYNLEMYFPNESHNQNEDQGKVFKAHISIEKHDVCSDTNCLKNAILAQVGGKGALENQTGYQELEEIFDIPEGENWFEGNEWAVGTGYVLNSEAGTYNLVDYTTNNTLSSAHINHYVCWAQNQYSDCTDIFQIRSVNNNIVSSILNKSIIDKKLVIGSAEDDYGTSYYYRGKTEDLNNNLIFGGFQWKIIRINGDESIRLIYNGTETDFNTNGIMNTEGVNTQINGIHVWNNILSENNNDDIKYAGYMYGGPLGSISTVRDGSISTAATYNETSSNVKNQLDSWYQNNISGQSFENKIVDNIFCNDRQLRNEIGGGPTGSGYGNSLTYFAAHYRLFDNHDATLKCARKNDRFTAEDTIQGNGALTYPVGLITADEIMKAEFGYLCTQQYFWTMTPYGNKLDDPYHNVGFLATYSGFCDLDFNSRYSTSYGAGLRPVINLDSEVTVNGDGSATNPFRVILD